MTEKSTSLSVEKAKELLGGKKCNYSEEKISSIVSSFEKLSDSIIDILDEEPELFVTISGFAGKSKQVTMRNINEQKRR